MLGSMAPSCFMLHRPTMALRGVFTLPRWQRPPIHPPTSTRPYHNPGQTAILTNSSPPLPPPFFTLTDRPDDGCIVFGLYLEGARWDETKCVLAESRPKELFTQMYPIMLLPKANRVLKSKGVYVCPCYKTLERAGMLSTTGHSTNFVLPLEIPSEHDQTHWIKRATALVCALDY